MYAEFGDGTRVVEHGGPGDWIVRSSLARGPLMRGILSWLRYIVLGAEKPQALEEESYPRDAAGSLT